MMYGLFFSCVVEFLANTLLRIFVSVFISDIVNYFFSSSITTSFWYQFNDGLI